MERFASLPASPIRWTDPRPSSRVIPNVLSDKRWARCTATNRDGRPILRAGKVSRSGVIPEHWPRRASPLTRRIWLMVCLADLFECGVGHGWLTAIGGQRGQRRISHAKAASCDCRCPHGCAGRSARRRKRPSGRQESPSGRPAGPTRRVAPSLCRRCFSRRRRSRLIPCATRRHGDAWPATLAHHSGERLKLPRR
jgi:hypothetical protein